MLIYLLTFALSLAFIYLGLHNKKNRPLSIIFFIIGIAIPCFLAAARSINIGTDTKGYVSSLFEEAQQSTDIGDFFSIAKYRHDMSDYGYLTLNYVFSCGFNNFSLFLFVIELLIILPIFLALKNSNLSNKSLIVSMSLFYLFEYNISFNMIRQCLAMSFIIYTIHLLIHNKTKWSILFFILACSFHNTAAICIILFPIYYAFKKLNGKNKKIFKVILYTLLGLSVLLFKEIVVLLYNTGIYPHGKLYLENYTTSFDFNFTDTFTYLITILMYIIFSKLLNKKDKNHDFYKTLGISGLVLLPLGWYILYMERASFYLFYPFLLYALPNTFDNVRNNKKTDTYILILLLYFLCYWFFTYVVLGLHDTIPYSFAWGSGGLL